MSDSSGPRKRQRSLDAPQQSVQDFVQRMRKRGRSARQVAEMLQEGRKRLRAKKTQESDSVHDKFTCSEKESK
jgi:hypothetical protein